MLGQLFPRHECAKRKISTNNNLSFKSSKLKRKSLLGQKKKEKTSREWKRRAQTIQDPDLRYFDLWREGTPGCSEIHLQKHPLGGRRHRRKCQSILISLSLFQGRWCQYYLNTHRWYITYLEHCLQISPRTPFPRKPFLLPLIVFWCRQRQFIFTMKKLLNHRFPEAHYNVFHGCIISSQKEPKSFSTV